MDDIIKIKIHSSCEIEYFVENHLCKLCVILLYDLYDLYDLSERYGIGIGTATALL